TRRQPACPAVKPAPSPPTATTRPATVPSSPSTAATTTGGRSAPHVLSSERDGASTAEVGRAFGYSAPAAPGSARCSLKVVSQTSWFSRIDWLRTSQEPAG